MKVYLLLIAIIIVTVIVMVVIFSKPAEGKYDSFAKCLNDNEVKMYGAYWCSHCKNQKEIFGSSWQYMNYVECSSPDGNSQLQVCADANIEAYPTWEFSDGSRTISEMSFEQLAQKSGCELPE